MNVVTSNSFLENGSILSVESWSFLTNHARVLLCIARDPAARLRDIAASLGITERSAYGIINDLTAAASPAARARQPGTRDRRRPGGASG